jgi:hypothetical protein
VDITNTTEPKSDQQNYDDYIAGPKTVTVTEVKKGSAEQPVELHLAEFPGRPYKPGKSMRRVLVTCWGPEASEYVGRKLTLYGDPTIRFGAEAVGGIRIAALSHITEPKTISLTVTRGKRAPFIVQPIADVAPHLAALKSAKTLEDLQAMWVAAQGAGVTGYAEVVAAKDARKAELGVTDA